MGHNSSKYQPESAVLASDGYYCGILSYGTVTSKYRSQNWKDVCNWLITGIDEKDKDNVENSLKKFGYCQHNHIKLEITFDFFTLINAKIFIIISNNEIIKLTHRLTTRESIRRQILTFLSKIRKSSNIKVPDMFFENIQDYIDQQFLLDSCNKTTICYIKDGYGIIVDMTDP